MKSIIRLSFVLALVLALPALKLYAQSTFEGTITMSITMPMMGDEDKHSSVVNIKGDKVETETDLGTMGVVKTYTDRSAKKVYSVMEAMHMGYTSDIPDDSKDTSSVDIKATGKKDNIAGHSAEEYTFHITSKMGEADCSVWESKDFPQSLRDNAKNLGSQGGASMSNAFTKLAKMGYFPVKIVVSKDGEVALTQELVKYEEKKLDDALFVPPTDIKFQPMPQMGGGHGMN